MLRYALPARGFIRFFLVCLTFFSIVVLSSFHSPAKTAGKTLRVPGLTGSQKKAYGITAIPVFKMSKAIFDNYGASWDRRIILQFSIKNVTSEIPSVGLISYLATSQDDHAEGEIPDQLQALNEYFSLVPYPEIILGNNYVHMREIKKMINSLPPNQVFDHIRFVPMVSKKYPGYIAFNIEIYGANDTKLPFEGRTTDEAGDGETNPSPPASPDGN